MSSTLYHFTGESFGVIDWCSPVAGTTLVADSWRVHDGQAVALDRHQERFSRSAREYPMINETILGNFFEELRALIPRSGSWFPRVELVNSPGGPTLRYRERVAPPWSTEVTLAVAPHDPRTTPLIKGPDLEALMALRSAVGDPLTTEAVIVSAEGYLVEGAYSSLMVWPSGSPVPVITPRDTPRIPSITESVLVDIAYQRGIEPVEKTLGPEDLVGAEVWVLSALHGIRRATEWIGGPRLTSLPHRAEEWQHAWWSSRVAF